MNVPPDLSLVAAAIGHPQRMRMLTLLMAGRAATAKELAYGVGVTPGTATIHLHKLLRSRLIVVRAQGRHKYFQLASPDVASCVESMMSLAPAPTLESGVPPALRHARYCYDHLAGTLGTAIADMLQRRRFVKAENGGFVPTPAGRRWFARLGIDVDALQHQRRKLAPRCLDWSERRDHLGGALGAALASRFSAEGWIKRRVDSREVVITAKGGRLFREAGCRL